jgi:electron transport complex protein RnfD
MTKDLLTKYTFIALCILAAVSIIPWGITPIVLCIISVLVAVTVDHLLSQVMKNKGQLDRWTAAAFGMMVALSYSLGIPANLLGIPSNLFEGIAPLTAPWAYVYVALISMVGMVFFEKLQSLLGRKYVNSVAAAELLVFLPSLYHVLTSAAHTQVIPSLTSAIGFQGSLSFGSFLEASFANTPLVVTNMQNVAYTLIVLKYNGWVGGASSIAVIAVGIALFALCRRFIKWRITATYLVTVAIIAFVLSIIYGGDPLLRVSFHLFIGSSIFFAFFMAIDPTTTPLTYLGQIIFGAALGVVTVAIQVYMGFFGGSILALVALNFTSPLLDSVGKLRPKTEKSKVKLPEAKQFYQVKITECIRCGACMRSCCHQLSPILIKQAYEKGNLKAARKLQPDLCDGCGNCSFVCPARIDLKGAVLKTQAALRPKL